MQVQIHRPFRIGTLDLPPLEWKTPARPRNRYTERIDAVELIQEALAHNPSDIHINCGHPVVLEIHGVMHRLTDHELEWAEFENIARVVRDKEGATSILSQGEDYDGPFIIAVRDPKHGKTRRRLRVNMTALDSIRATQSGSFVMRPLQDFPPSVDEIGLPQELLDHCFPERGGVYVIGPTGSGKTSTFAALVRYAAETGRHYHGHWATYESPPEYDLEAASSQHLMITQVAVHSKWGLSSFADAVRNAMRRHPVAILIGEIRDYETVSAVVEASLTGHPVFGTVHADNPATAFQRLITRYPAAQSSAALYDLITTTEVIIAQRLVKRLDGGRVALREWIVFDDEIRKRLLRLNTTGEVTTEIMSLVESNGQSYKKSATELLSKGIISETVAAPYLKR